MRTDAVVVSVNYRHAPEHRFPAAIDDGPAALRWIADHTGALGGIPGWLAVCGWSAGGGMAAVVSRLARDAGGPRIVAQVMLTPVTDCDETRASYTENGDGYGFTAPLDALVYRLTTPTPRCVSDPRIAPLRVGGPVQPAVAAIVVTGGVRPAPGRG